MKTQTTEYPTFRTMEINPFGSQDSMANWWPLAVKQELETDTDELPVYGNAVIEIRTAREMTIENTRIFLSCLGHAVTVAEMWQIERAGKTVAQVKAQHPADRGEGERG